jgi:hypothetical protein
MQFNPCSTTLHYGIAWEKRPSNALMLNIQSITWLNKRRLFTVKFFLEYTCGIIFPFVPDLDLSHQIHRLLRLASAHVL